MATQARVIDLRKKSTEQVPLVVVHPADEREYPVSRRKKPREPRREWMTAKMLAQYWNKSLSTISRRKLRQDDPIPFHDGLVDRSEADAWLKRQPAGGRK